MSAPKSPKLNDSLRLKIINFAVTKFIDQALRDAEATAREKIMVEFDKMHKKTIAPKLEMLKSFGVVRSFTNIRLPCTMQIQTDSESIDNNGVEVLRQRYRTLRTPTKPGVRRFDNFAYAKIQATNNSFLYDEDRNIITAKYDIPGIARNDRTFDILDESCNYGSRFYDCNNQAYSEISSGRAGHEGFWIGKKVYDAVVAYLIASEKRAEIENRILATVIKLLDASVTLADVESFMPDIVEIKDTLFPADGSLKIYALVAVSAEEKALVCANIASRGVGSVDMCAV